MNGASWICCQLGARENYVAPHALHKAGLLSHLITDVWAKPGSIWTRLPESPGLIRMKQRYNPALAKARVHSSNTTFAAFELAHYWQRGLGWDLIMKRNRLFQKRAIHQLRRLERRGSICSKAGLFLYSYAALEVLRYAKDRGWTTALEQIDPGPVEMNIVRAECTKYYELAPQWVPTPTEYWSLWREECNLADYIIVNSDWSLNCLREVNVPNHKIRLIPLAYQSLGDQNLQPKSYPTRFTIDRPLRILFLGQINLRKGVARLLKAAACLKEFPIEFLMVGPVQIKNAESFAPGARLRWFGPTSRLQAIDYYREADLFVIPTLSDGFALTQLEALANRVPVITSTFCGRVVRDEIDGIVLKDVTPEAISDAILRCFNDPGLLEHFSSAAGVREEFTLSTMGRSLTKLCQ